MNLTFVTSFFDFFLPRFCPACNKKLPAQENLICRECILKIERTDSDLLKSEYDRKFSRNRIVSDFYSHFVFKAGSELQAIIHAFKYEKKFLLGKMLGEMLAKGLEERMDYWKIDYIIPTPLHYMKKSERGFNQSYFIAAGIKNILGMGVKNDIVKRIRHTKSQTTMSMSERTLNVNGAFKVKNEKIIKDKNILIIDDVITTGSTIQEIGKVLLNAGANKIFAASAAIADPKEDMNLHSLRSIDAKDS